MEAVVRPHNAGMRMLLVEDDAMIGEVVLDALRAEHHAVDWVRDGAVALTALATAPYDLLLLDLGLPRQDGLSVLRQLRADHQRLPVLIATARDAVADRVAGLDAGADDYIVKPYDLMNCWRACGCRRADGRRAGLRIWARCASCQHARSVLRAAGAAVGAPRAKLEPCWLPGRVLPRQQWKTSSTLARRHATRWRSTSTACAKKLGAG